jgi:hypothetical protein
MNQIKYLTIFSLLVCGCGGSSSVIINPQYSEEVSLKNRNLNILLIIPSDSINVKNIDDVKDDFPNDTCRPPSIVIQDSLSKTIQEEYENHFISVHPLFAVQPSDSLKSQNDKGQFEISKKYINKKDTMMLTFTIPQKQRLIDSGIQTDLCLLINKMILGRNIRDSLMLMPTRSYTYPIGMSGLGMTAKVRSQENLDVYFQFILWDYKNDCEIAYGKLFVTYEFAFGLAHGVWKEVFRQIAKEILKETPLKFKPMRSNVSW